MAYAKNLAEGWLTPSELAGADQWVMETSWLDARFGRQLSLQERATLMTELQITAGMAILGKSPVSAGANGSKTAANSSGGNGGGGAKDGMLGAQGVQTASKTIWKGNGKERLDVENPNPGQRPGQIHYQDNDGNKYLYDPSTKSFPDAPRSVNKLLENSRFLQAIDKGLKKYLGE